MPEIRISEDLEQVAAHAAEEVVSRARTAVAERGRFTLVLAGGSTPKALYRLLAGGGEPPFRERIDWQRAWLFQGDERAVPIDHPDSNFRMQSEALLDKVPLPPGQMLRFDTEDSDRDRAARRYEDGVRLALGLATGDWPLFDLVLLGMGEDGHTASLFPGTRALGETARIAVANQVERLGTWRFTLTARAINHARAVMFLVAGAKKAAALAGVLEGQGAKEEMPARLIQPEAGNLLWLADRAAAAGLHSSGTGTSTQPVRK